jgi:hypothetical protein
MFICLEKIIHCFSFFDVFVHLPDTVFALMIHAIPRIPSLLELLFQLCLTTFFACFIGTVFAPIMAAVSSAFKILTCEYLIAILNDVVHYLQKGSCKIANTENAVIKMMMA